LERRFKSFKRVSVKIISTKALETREFMSNFIARNLSGTRHSHKKRGDQPEKGGRSEKH
jgi:hypothetical protein